MTEKQLRTKIVDLAKSYLNVQKGSAAHKAIVDAYNSYLPHPRGYALTVKDNWCAAFTSAMAILCGMVEIIPIECSCNEQIKMWRSMGRWEENDAYRPEPGDFVYYDWQDTGKGDNTGAADHVGIVTWVSGNCICVIEGNKGNASIVGYRELTVNGKYIRGYGLPDFALLARPEVCSVELPKLARGDTGGAVRSLQTLLNQRGAKLAVDGSFGPATQAAVEAFRSGAGLARGASVDSQMWTRLIYF